MIMNKNKKFLIGAVICLLPILIGNVLWSLLPENLVRHLGPGSYSFSSKKIVVFLYPLLFLLLHIIMVFKSDWLNYSKNEKRYWYIPVFSSIFFFISFTLSFINN